jgi:hypothetical protein
LTGRSHAELVLGTVPSGDLAAAASLAHTVNDAGSLSPPVLTSSDWMRRGALAERLGHVGDARAAYSAAVQLHFSLSCYTALLRLSAQAGSVSDVFVCAAQVLTWHQQRIDSGGGGGGGASGSGSTSIITTGVPPEVVSWAVGLLAAHEGWAAPPVDMPPALVPVLQSWKKWQSVVWRGLSQFQGSLEER